MPQSDAATPDASPPDRGGAGAGRADTGPDDVRSGDTVGERGNTRDPRDPWATVASREVYANPWISVREDDVVRPDGSPGIYGVVSTALAVGVVAVTASDEVVLVGQWRYTLDAYSWEIVEGGADPGEDGLAAARRELAEEAGLTAASWERLGHDLALSNSISDEVARIWLARDLTEVPRDPDPTEVLEVRHVPLDEALAMVDRGEITDAISVVALSTLDRRRRGSS